MKGESILALAVVVLLAGLSGSVWAGTYSGGTGEPNDPYRIATANDLNDIGNHIEDLNKHFVMVNDINLADYSGAQFNIIGNDGNAFTGVFDGNANSISNFSYEISSGSNIALFRSIDDPNAVIRNLTLVDPNVNGGTGDRVAALVGELANGTISGCSVQGGSVSGRHCVGGLIGDAAGSSPLYIINCSADVNVTTTGFFAGGLVGYWSNGIISGCFGTGDIKGSFCVGGLVGSNRDGLIISSYATGSVWCDENLAGGLSGRSSVSYIVSCYATGTASGSSGCFYIGGLVGHIDQGSVAECYATGDVGGIGLNDVGGLAGYHKGSSPFDEGVMNCYATGSVRGDSRIGGLIGVNYGSVYNCYAAGIVDGNNLIGGLGGIGGDCTMSFWDQTVNPDVNGVGIGSDPNVIGKSTAEMMAENTFSDAGWDFVEVWGIGENQTYPFLRVYPPGDLNHDKIVNFEDVAILANHWLEEK